MPAKAVDCDVYLLFGSLGSGKTTVLQELLSQCSDDTIAVLVNDFGAYNMDAAIIRQSNRNLLIEEISGGCICCSLRTKLHLALRNLAKYSITMLFLEATGLAMPQDILHLFAEPEFAQYKIREVITVVDSRQFLQGNGRNRPYYRQQLRRASWLIANKRDLLTAGTEEKVYRDLREATPHAAILATSFGKLPTGFLRTASELYQDSILYPESVLSVIGHRDGWQEKKVTALLEPSFFHPTHDPGEVSFSFIRGEEVRYKLESLEKFFASLGQIDHPLYVERIKGWVSTESDLFFIQWSKGGVSKQPWQRESVDVPTRLEIIAKRGHDQLQRQWAEAMSACEV